MDQRNEAADMMQDRCNGFSGQALHHLNASEACQRALGASPWPAFTQPARIAWQVGLFRVLLNVGFLSSCDWWRVSDLNSRRITSRDGSKDSSK
jgi:hypothetical protein